MTRPALLLLAALAATPALACAPPPEPEPVSACALVRLDEAHACIEDPGAPGGIRIVARVDPELPDCGAPGCVRPLPLPVGG